MINGPRILLVDDSMTTLLFMATALQRVGYTVDTALDGRAVLQKVTMQQPHCLVLDIILPGINGYTICRQVRARDPQHNLPILFISTKNTLFDRNYGLSLGADQYLAKPFTEEILVQTVWNLLPVHIRPIQSPPPPQQTDTRLANLIPSRRDDPALLATKNPFANTARMDVSVHKLYTAIDGQKTVKTLREITGFDMPKIVGLLKILLEQQRIELYDQKEHRIVKSLLDYL